MVMHSSKYLNVAVLHSSQDVINESLLISANNLDQCVRRAQGIVKVNGGRLNPFQLCTK